MSKLLVLVLCSVFAAAAGPKDSAIDAEAESERICRSESFQGCCSWNEGLADERTGRCNNNTISDRCEDRWTLKLQGWCSHNGGIDFVDADGTVRCRHGDPKGGPRIIEKCPAPAK